MFTIFSGKTADDVWLKAAQHLIAGKGIHDKPSRAGETRELLHAGFCISDPRQRWVFSRVPPINIAFALAEIVWIINGRNDARFLTYWNGQLPKYVGNARRLHGAYGFRLRQHLKFDQLKRAYLALKSNPNTRQVVLQIWDSKADLPNRNGAPVNDDIPCNIVSLIKVLEGHLDWLQIMRSNDIHLGTPYNFVQFTYLQEVMAGWLGLEVGSYNHMSDSLHAYLRNMKDLQKAHRLKSIRSTDSIAVPYAVSMRYFVELSHRVDRMVKSQLTVEELIELSRWDSASIGFKNILSVLIAEKARKSKLKELSLEIINRCSNPALQKLWIQWASRFNRGNS